MVEVFKTNVTDSGQANILLDMIQKIFPEDKINFDLDDCDKILRVESESNTIEASKLISLLNSFGFKGEILPDDHGPMHRNLFLKAGASLK